MAKFPQSWCLSLSLSSLICWQNLTPSYFYCFIFTQFFSSHVYCDTLLSYYSNCQKDLRDPTLYFLTFSFSYLNFYVFQILFMSFISSLPLRSSHILLFPFFPLPFFFLLFPPFLSLPFYPFPFFPLPSSSFLSLNYLSNLLQVIIQYR